MNRKQTLVLVAMLVLFIVALVTYAVVVQKNTSRPTEQLRGSDSEYRIDPASLDPTISAEIATRCVLSYHPSQESGPEQTVKQCKEWTTGPLASDEKYVAENVLFARPAEWDRWKEIDATVLTIVESTRQKTTSKQATVEINVRQDVSYSNGMTDPWRNTALTVTMRKVHGLWKAEKMELVAQSG